MKKIYTGVLAALGLLAGTYVSADAELIINELMQSNIDCIMDDLKEFPDSWVELYNSGTSSVSLSDYALSISDKIKKAYSLPTRNVAPGEHVLIYCDKEGNGYHASFRLESGKDGAVYLFKNGEITDRITGMKKQPAPNIAYGRKTDGSDEWGYQANPTPGSSNCGTVCNDILGAPVFSVPGKVFSSYASMALELKLPDDAPEGTVIRYTLNGKEPTETSAVYAFPISLSKTTTVRAKLFCEGYLSPRSTTQSYIFLNRDMTMPVVSIVTNPDYFYSDALGIYNDKNNGDNARHDWRRPVNMEVFWSAGDKSVINQLCETRVKGGATRSMPLKSLALYANKRFGEKRFNHEFFPEDAPGLTNWKSIELRNAGNDFDYLYFRDALIQRNIGRRTDLDWQPYQPAIVFINGEYKGMLNFRSRSNEDFVYTFYDGLEDVDVVENWNEVKEGDDTNLKAFKEFYNGHGHTYAEYDAIMDVGEFCNLMIAESFHNNLDFPGNNIEMWRPTADGGRWRWIAKDTDFGLGLYNRQYDYKYLNWLYDPNYDYSNAWANKPEHTRLFRRLMDIPRFKDMFIDRCAVYMGDFMNGNVIGDEIDAMADAIQPEYSEYHRPLYNRWWPNYNDEVKAAKSWAKNRTEFFYKHMAEFFGLGKPVVLSIDGGRQDNVNITVNDVPLYGRSFNGKFFSGRPLHLSASVSDGGMVSGWKVTVTLNGGSSTQEIQGNEVTLTIPSDANSVIISTLTDYSGIEGIDSGTNSLDPSLPVDVYNASGVCIRKSAGNVELSSLPSGIYILIQGNAIRKIIL